MHLSVDLETRKQTDGGNEVREKCHIYAFIAMRDYHIIVSTDDSGQTESMCIYNDRQRMSHKSPRYRRFYRDMLARLIVRLYRDKS